MRFWRIFRYTYMHLHRRNRTKTMKKLGALFIGSCVVFFVSKEVWFHDEYDSSATDDNFLRGIYLEAKVHALPKVSTVEYAYAGKILNYNNGQWSVRPQKCKEIRNHRHHKGRLKHHSNTTIYVYDQSDDSWISGSILNNGEWKGNLSVQINQLLLQDRERTFIDIGANLGIFAIPAALTGSHVIAIDCVRETLQNLCLSLRRNHVQDRVAIIHNAVWRSNAYATLQATPGNIGGTKLDTILESWQSRDVAREVVPTIKLDDLLEIFNISKAVIKMSVEGDEVKVLEGAGRFFKTVRVDYVVMEFVKHRRALSAFHVRDYMHKYKMVPMVSEALLKERTYVKWPSVVIWKRQSM